MAADIEISPLKNGMDKLNAKYPSSVSEWTIYKEKLNGGHGGNGAPFGANGLGYDSGKSSYTPDGASTLSHRDHYNVCSANLFKVNSNHTAFVDDNDGLKTKIGSFDEGESKTLTHKVFIVIKKES